MFMQHVLRLVLFLSFIPLFCVAESRTFDFHFPKEELRLVSSEKYTLAYIEQCEHAKNQPGSPQLPVKYVNVMLPSGAHCTGIDVTSDDTFICSHTVIYPTQPQHKLTDTKPAFVPPDDRVYTSHQKVPAERAEYADTYIMRGHSIVSLQLNPLTYIPARGEVYMSTQIHVTVHYEIPEQRRAASGTPYLYQNALFDSIIKESIINPEQLAENTSERVPSYMPRGGAVTTDYLIITGVGLTNAFQVLADHRAQKNGMSTKILTVEYITNSYNGLDIQDKIRECIRYFVYSNNLTFVVLGGDDTIVPKRGCPIAGEASMPTDLYYAGLDGTWDDVNTNGIYGEWFVNSIPNSHEYDLMPEVIVGRIPVRTHDHTMTYINALKDFENNPPPNSYFRKMLICGARLWDDYSGNNRPSDTMYDGHSGFRDHEPVTDAEMWGRRMLRDIIQPYWTPIPIHFLFDSLTSWDTTIAGDYMHISGHIIEKLNEGYNLAPRKNEWVNSG